MKTSPKILLSGGGTGGHIFPAVAIADELQKRFPSAEFLFIGARDKMEMQKVPSAGYAIKGLWISGFNRSNMFANIQFPFKVLSSIKDSRMILQNFQPDLAIGTGGFASGPALWVASRKGVPIFLQEQNSFPGVTNKLLKSKAEKIYVAYDRMEKYFPKDKLLNSGNPIRESLFAQKIDSKEAKRHLGMDPEKLTILSIGGSLGSRTLNNAWKDNLEVLDPEKVQLYWQTGSTDYESIMANNTVKRSNIFIQEFIQQMSWAYAAADIIVSRAGAIAVSELCVAGKATVLVPLPHAAEDHQTKNAENLVHHHATLMVKDAEVKEKFAPTINQLIEDKELRNSLSQEIKKLAKPHATQTIVEDIIKTMEQK